MIDLNDDLAHFARAIVHGDKIPALIGRAYANYSVDTALEVYRNNYRGNLHDALAGAYPVIVQLVGDEFFRFLSKKYIETNQSHSANLYHYGAEMARFLENFAPAQELVYLSDIAALEWACHIAYFAEDQASLALDSLAQIPPERYSDLILHTACQVVRSDFPVTAIWLAHQPGADCGFQIDLDSGRSIALVSRKQYVVQVSELSDADAGWLQRIQAGDTLGVATTATMALCPDFDLQAALLNLLARNVLTGFDLGTAT
ncbi:MAG: DNA-binding domain-containing protein [Gallionella sp.]